MNDAAAIAPDTRPRLPHGVRLVHNEAQGGWVLLAPERVFKADAIAVEILALHRRRGRSAPSSTILPRPMRPRERIEGDVTALLRGLADKKLLEL